MATSAFAQPTVVKAQKDVTARDGSTVTYSVTGSGTFHWAISGGSNTNTVTSSSTNSVNVTWDNATPGTVYNLDVYLVDGKGEQHIEVEGKVGYRFFGELILDCLNRSEKAMTQAHAFKAAELCLKAQAAAKTIL